MTDLINKVNNPKSTDNSFTKGGYANMYDQLYKTWNVSNDEQLFNVMMKESETLPCQSCGKEIEITKLHFSSGDPICYKCLCGE
jgi:hypothetical protein